MKGTTKHNWTASDKAFDTFKNIRDGEPYSYPSNGKTWKLEVLKGGYYQLTHDKSPQKRKIPARAALRILTHIFNQSCNICGISGPTHCTDQANCLNVSLAAEQSMR